MKRLLLVFLLVILQYGRSDVPSQMVLSVYYESKCPDSENFIVEQLKPAVDLLGDHLKLHLLPFGKAHSINHGEDGFECQHGPSECLGNLVQDCTLYHMQDRPDSEKVSYVSCEMTSLKGTTRDFSCVQNMNWPVERIQECVNSDEGKELQLDAEYATKVLSPQFIPTITLNQEFNEQIQKEALEDLIGMLCSMMKDIPPCAERYNHQALDHILV